MYCNLLHPLNHEVQFSGIDIFNIYTLNSNYFNQKWEEARQWKQIQVRLTINSLFSSEQLDGKPNAFIKSDNEGVDTRIFAYMPNDNFKFFDGVVDHGMPNYVKAISKQIKK